MKTLDDAVKALDDLITEGVSGADNTTYSLAPVAGRLGELLATRVIPAKHGDCGASPEYLEGRTLPRIAVLGES